MRILHTIVLSAVIVLAAASRAHAAPGGPRKNVFLHYDYMAGNGISTAPSADQIDAVVKVFAQHGIDLIIDPVHKALPLFQYMYLPFPGVPLSGDDQFCVASFGAVNFYDLKAQYYRSHRPKEHYVIFGLNDLGVQLSLSLCWQMAHAESGRSSAVPGSDFVVATGISAITSAPLGIGGTFMHELGHNLGLFHGGDESLNYKPNYISVMNYSFQTGIHAADSPASTTGIPVDCPRFCTGGTGWTGIDDPALLHLDYSGQALPTLDTASLNEGAGLGAGKNILGGYDLSFISSNPYSSLCFYQTIIPSSGAVDFNCNGSIESSVGGFGAGENEIDYFGCFDALPYTCSKFHGFDDWAEVHACIETECSFSPVHGRPELEKFPPGTSPGNVTFQVDYGIPGTIAGCGRTFSDGQSANCGRKFDASADVAPRISAGGNTIDFLFKSWYWSGGVSCISPVINPASCTNNGSGMLGAIYGVNTENIANRITVGLAAPPSPANGSTVTAASVTLAVHLSFSQTPYVVPVTVYADNELGNWQVACTGWSDPLGNFACSFAPSLDGHTYRWEVTASYFPGYFFSDFAISDVWTFKYTAPPPPPPCPATGC